MEVGRYINNSKNALEHPEDMTAFMDDGIDWIIDDLKTDKELYKTSLDRYGVDDVEFIAKKIWYAVVPTTR